MKNSYCLGAGSHFNMLIAGLSATMPNPFGWQWCHLDNVVCDHSITQRLNWQTVLLWNVLSEEVGLGQVEVLKQDKATHQNLVHQKGHREGYRSHCIYWEFNFPFMSPSNEFHWNKIKPWVDSRSGLSLSTVLLLPIPTQHPSRLSPPCASAHMLSWPLGDRTVFCVPGPYRRAFHLSRH